MSTKELGSLSTEHIGTDCASWQRRLVPLDLWDSPGLSLLLWPQGYGDSLAGMFLLNPRPVLERFNLSRFRIMNEMQALVRLIHSTRAWSDPASNWHCGLLAVASRTVPMQPAVHSYFGINIMDGACSSRAILARPRVFCMYSHREGRRA